MQKGKGKILNHAGITLVELLVVIAIMSIIVGFTGISISLVYSRDCESCAKMIDGAMEVARMNGMTRTGDYTLTIDAANKLVQVTSASSGAVVFEKKIQQRVTVTGTIQGNGVSLSGINKTEIIFNKATGAVKKITADGTLTDGATILISSTNVDGKSATAKLVAATGKHLITYP